METLAPSYLLLLEVHYCLSSGESMRQGIISFIKQSKDPFAAKVSQWLAHLEQSTLDAHFFSTIKEPQRRILLQVLSYGWMGHPILDSLNRLKIEFEEMAESEIETKIQKLPFQMMIPLLLFQFPGIFLLLVGPILISLLNQLGSS